MSLLPSFPCLYIYLLLLPLSFSLSCPPFQSSPPKYPFSPPFQIHCSRNISQSLSYIYIKNISFSIISLSSHTSIRLKLKKQRNAQKSLSLNLSHSPFRLARSSCTSKCTVIEVEWEPKKENNGRVLLLVFTLVVLTVTGGITLALVVRRYRRRKVVVLGGGEDPTELYLHRHRSASLLPPVFTYEELQTATNGFDSRRKIGDGGFGSVFLGQLYDGRIVAVKHLHRGGGKSFLTKSFCNEILIMSSIDHVNLVKLHGYCSDTRGLILVYDYVSNGTLFEHLHKRAYRKGAMTWRVRVEIALQIALAIEYLHFSVLPPIVHRDITSSNIFVEKDMRIKVGDFGLSRLLIFSEKTMEMGSDGCVWTGPQGTPGYLDPDYHRSFRLTEKSDVYSFGVVLLELVTGLKAVDLRREKREVALADMAVGRIQMGLLNQVVDPALVVEGEVVEGVGAVAELAFRCVAVDKDDRPDAREVVAELRRISNHIPGGISRGLNLKNVVVPSDGV